MDRPELLHRSLQRETQEDIANLNYQLFSDADAQAARKKLARLMADLKKSAAD